MAMRILALDHGTKRIGVAVSDELRACFKASPVPDYTSYYDVRDD
jgi:RNase H-fold protein (predicted Holliday junction resolvase)